MNESLRGTGRTTRMLEAAIRKALTGNRVYVYGASIQHARILADMAYRITEEKGLLTERLAVSIFSFPGCGGSMSFETIQGAGVDYVMRLQEQQPGTHFIDHYVLDLEIESLNRHLERTKALAQSWDARNATKPNAQGFGMPTV